MQLKMNTGITWTQLELTGLLEDEDSKVFFERSRRHLGLHPFHLTDMNAALNEILSGTLNNYDSELNGIVLSYKNPKLLTPLGNILYDTYYIHVDIVADFYVFRPEIGCSLRGFVNKKSNGHVGILVHKAFNVSVPKPDNVKEWPGDKVISGQEVRFTVKFLDFDGRIPYIRGILDPVHYLDGCKLFNADFDEALDMEPYVDFNERNYEEEDQVTVTSKKRLKNFDIGLEIHEPKQKKSKDRQKLSRSYTDFINEDDDTPKKKIKKSKLSNLDNDELIDVDIKPKKTSISNKRSNVTTEDGVPKKRGRKSKMSFVEDEVASSYDNLDETGETFDNNISIKNESIKKRSKRSGPLALESDDSSDTSIMSENTGNSKSAGSIKKENEQKESLKKSSKKSNIGQLSTSGNANVSETPTKRHSRKSHEKRDNLSSINIKSEKSILSNSSDTEQEEKEIISKKRLKRSFDESDGMTNISVKCEDSPKKRHKKSGLIDGETMPESSPNEHIVRPGWHDVCEKYEDAPKRRSKKLNHTHPSILSDVKIKSEDTVTGIGNSDDDEEMSLRYIQAWSQSSNNAAEDIEDTVSRKRFKKIKPDTSDIEDIYDMRVKPEKCTPPTETTTTEQVEIKSPKKHSKKSKLSNSSFNDSIDIATQSEQEEYLKPEKKVQSRSPKKHIKESDTPIQDIDDLRKIKIKSEREDNFNYLNHSKEEKTQRKSLKKEPEIYETVNLIDEDILSFNDKSERDASNSLKKTMTKSKLSLKNDIVVLDSDLEEESVPDFGHLRRLF
ncbi:ABC transporter F family member 4 [Orussus abietinus]|uniref:ABC transporter F family member 4 n=1 Tax=Orussus abietinus TaxID=222816 RepID=UPI0006260495|nr:ABC transporter F family member 4 [Orussus abietinus]